MSTPFGKRLLLRFGPPLAAGFIRALGATLRIRVSDPHGVLDAPPAAAVAVFWHNRIVMMPYIYARFRPQARLSTIMSRSKDGSLIADIAARFGVHAMRGSTSKGAAGVSRAALRALAEGGWVGITPDGPRGPVNTVKPGLASLVRKAQVPIVPVVVHYGWKIRASSWDRLQIPLPFSRVEVVVGKSIMPNEQELERAVMMALGV
jgi:lysophospholipid acyltransferase (LPLAT)-like uncharacterized protein